MQRNEADKLKLNEIEIANRELIAVSDQLKCTHFSVMNKLECAKTENGNKFAKA